MEQVLASIVAAAAPLVYATTGETISERAGVINLSVEGSMMLAAMAGFATAVTSGSVPAGFAVAAAVGAAVALVVAAADIRLRRDQIAVGFVLTILCAELADYLGTPFVRRPGPHVPHLPIPGLADLPVLGRALFAQDPVVYGSLVLIVLATWALFSTRWGLALQAVGERPEAAHARGLPVQRIRSLAAAVGGALVGVAGAAFSLDIKLGWSAGHTRNFGWIALAIVIFGGWHPVRVALGCYLFGALQVLAGRLQPLVPDLAQVLPVAPFPLMIGALLLVRLPAAQRLARRSPLLHRLIVADPPEALGRPFHLERPRRRAVVQRPT